MTRTISLFAALLLAGSLASINGCEKAPAPNGAGTPTGSSSGAGKHDDHAHADDDHDHAEGDGHEGDHAHAEGDSKGHDEDGHEHAAGEGHDDHGPTVELGTAPIGAFVVKASRGGDIEAGGEAAVDLWITPGAGTKIGTVRAWIGTQDAMGSMKAKMDLEKDNYHSHVEVPKPMPAGSKLWIEIEDDKGVKTAGSFDLKS